TMHGLNSPGRYSAVMTGGERVVCVSGSVRAYVLMHYPDVDPGKLRVIPRGIDTTQFPRVPAVDRAARARFANACPQLGGEGPLLLLPGRGTRLKGHREAVSLLGNLRSQGIDARLWMPGARENGREQYVSDLELQAKSGGFLDALALTPPIADIAEAYAASDLVLQLSRKPEAFGRTVIEALSVGRPVLGWAHGGVGELLAELQPCGSVRPFDEDALASAAQALLERPPSPLASMPYTLRAMQDATLALYLELADESSRHDAH
ncbi:MAG: glycosyltransferase, partial [Oxalobacteraceae bacterium]